MKQTREQLLQIVKDCDWNDKTILISSACIELKKPLPIDFFKKIRNSARFNCIEVTFGCHNEFDQNHNYLSCTCIDSKLGTIFGLDVNFERIVLIPKHRVKQETFVDFYKYVEKFSKEIELTTFSKWANERQFRQGVKS